MEIIMTEEQFWQYVNDLCNKEHGGTIDEMIEEYDASFDNPEDFISNRDQMVRSFPENIQSKIYYRFEAQMASSNWAMADYFMCRARLEARNGIRVSEYYNNEQECINNFHRILTKGCLNINQNLLVDIPEDMTPAQMLEFAYQANLGYQGGTLEDRDNNKGMNSFVENIKEVIGWDEDGTCAVWLGYLEDWRTNRAELDEAAAAILITVTEREISQTKAKFDRQIEEKIAEVQTHVSELQELFSEEAWDLGFLKYVLGLQKKHGADIKSAWYDNDPGIYWGQEATERNLPTFSITGHQGGFTDVFDDGGPEAPVPTEEDLLLYTEEELLNRLIAAMNEQDTQAQE